MPLIQRVYLDCHSKSCHRFVASEIEDATPQADLNLARDSLVLRLTLGRLGSLPGVLRLRIATKLLSV
jgi:hypothetical protein